MMDVNGWRRRRGGMSQRRGRTIGRLDVQAHHRRFAGLEPLEPRLMLDATVVFNELMYHAPDDVNSVEGVEWIELHNQTLLDMDLSNWRLDDGVGFTFPAGTRIAAGGYLVVATDPAAMAATTGYVGALGPFTGRLANGGERIELRNNADRIMDAIEYEDGDDWPTAADGSGATLAKRSPQAGSASAGNWAHSAQLGGTPGEVNFPTVDLTPTQTTLVGTFDDWLYEASGTDLGAAWREAGYDDSSWMTGPAPFYAGQQPGIGDLGTGGGGGDSGGAGQSAGVLSIVPITNDADSQITTDRVYTHKLDFGIGDSGAVVNGVTFTRVTAGTANAQPNFNWTVTSGSQNDFGFHANHNVTGSVVNLFSDFVYNGNNAANGQSILTISGLTPGRMYDTRVYVRQFGAQLVAPPGGRSSLIQFDTDAIAGAENSITLNEDNALHNPPGLDTSNRAYALSYQFTADTNRVVITFNQFNLNQSWHLYGLTNEDLGATNALTFTPITNDADSDITIDKLYTHKLDFGSGDSGAVINGVAFTRVTTANVDAIPGFGYTVGSGTRNDFGAQGITTVTGDVLQLFDDFMFNGGNAAGGTATITLSDLVVGQEYDTRIYARAFGVQPGAYPAGRSSQIQFDTDGLAGAEDSVNINQDDASANPPGLSAADRPYAIRYRFTADSDTLTITFTQQNANQSWHLYGLTNQVVGETNPDLTPITTLRSSGIGENGLPLPAGGDDPNWVNVATGQPLIVMANHPAWAANNTQSQWVGVTTDGQTNVPPGQYQFETTFDMTGWDADTARIELLIAVDDQLDAVLLNGVNTGITTAGFAILNGPFVLSDGFLPGVNTLRFIFTNGGAADNPSGLRVQMSGQAVQKLGQTELPLGPTTYYFRKPFTFNGDPTAEHELELDGLIDDGAIVYLNGQEIHRQNMPAGAVSHGTTATSNIGNAVFSGRFNVPASALQIGDNLLAVEVHQASGGFDDMAFAAQLFVTETPVPPDAQAKLVFNEVGSSLDAVFFVEVGNAGTQAVSLDGYIIHHPQSETDFVFGAVTLQPGQFVAVSQPALGFDPADGDRLFLYNPSRTAVLDGVPVDNELRGLYPDLTGRRLFPDQPTPGAANSFSFNDSVVINEIHYHDRSLPATPQIVEQNILIAPDHVWRYDQSGANLGTAWKEPVYSPADAWPSGQGLIAFETAALPEPIRTTLNNPLNNNPYVVTYYFRTTFEFDGDLGDGTLYLNHVLDDGAVFYLNGVEVARFNMPGGAISSSTFASSAVGDAAFSGLTAIPAGALQVGTNVLAVEVHQASSGSTDIVFGLQLLTQEVLTEAQPPRDSDTEWLELYNRSASPVDLTGWSLEGAVDYAFSAGTILAAGGYLVVARDAAAMAAAHPSIDVVGDYDGSLANSDDLIRLIDPSKNPADEVHYYDGGRWADLADGGGSSLELRDPDADNAQPEAWAASDESAKVGWQTVTYRGLANPLPGTNDPVVWNEFIFHLLDAGTFLLDDVSVVEDPDGTAIQVIQNGSFDTLSAWRMLGNHEFATIVPDPDNPANNVLRMAATGAGEHAHNHAETTFAGNRAIVNGREYEISFRVRWVAGSNQLNTRFYFNRLAMVTPMDVPTYAGTPGAANTRLAANIGPTYSHFIHSPAVPQPGQNVLVTADASDPDGVTGMTLYYNVNNGPFITAAMTTTDGVRYEGTIPGQAAGAIVQFYVQGEDGLGAISTYPAAGPESRAMLQVADGRARGGNDLRIIMDADDAARLRETTNALTNHRYGATIIYRESEIYYGAEVRLKGSPFGRPSNLAGFNIRFDPMDKFRDVHDGLNIDRKDQSNGTTAGISQAELSFKHMGTHAAGGIYGMYDDVVNLIPATANMSDLGGAGQLLMARYDDVFLDNQFDNGGDGTVFEFELIYYSNRTTDGNVQSLKLPPGFSSGFTVNGVDLGNKGENNEAYRWYFLIKNNRDLDDYSRLIDMNQTFSLTGSAFEQAIDDVIDVDQWMRTFSFIALAGIGDTYNGGLNHNLQFYVRPEDGRVLALPWDSDFTFTQPTNKSIYGDGNVALNKVVSIPKYRRLWDGHLLDIINTTFNLDYMTEWVNFYQTVGSRNDTARILNYISARRSYVLSQLPAPVPFEITTNGGANFAVNDTAVTLQGRGWIDVREIRLAGSDESLPHEFIDGQNWRITLPLAFGANALTFEAYNHQGQLVGTDTITVTSTVSDRPLEDFLRVTEVHYHPADPTQAEIDAGYSDQDLFEFIELTNIGPTAIDLTDARFTTGISFDFSQGSVTMLDPGQRIVVVSNTAAFAQRYGATAPDGTPIVVAGQFGGNLSNGGEQIVLATVQNAVILDFEYLDDWLPLTDGDGPSLDLIDPTADPSSWSDAASWRLSGIDGGTPSRLDPVEGAIPGDVNYNGTVEISDLSRLAVNFGLDGVANAMLDVRWHHGDLNGDRRVTITDLSILASRFGQSAMPGAAANDDMADLLAPTTTKPAVVLVPAAAQPNAPAAGAWSHIRNLLEEEGDTQVI